MESNVSGLKMAIFDEKFFHVDRKANNIIWIIYEQNGFKKIGKSYVFRKCNLVACDIFK